MTYLDQIFLQVAFALWGFFGFDQIPVSSAWHLEQAWSKEEIDHDHQKMVMRMSSTSIVDQCQSNPNQYIVLPFLIGASHQVYLDGRLVFSCGDPSFKLAKGYFHRPVLPCKILVSGNKIEWVVSTVEILAAHIVSLPEIRNNNPRYFLFFNEYQQILAAGALLFLAIVVLVLFRGKTSFPLFFAATIMMLSFGSYFLVHSRILEFFSVSYLRTSNLCVQIVWVGEMAFIYSLYLQGLFSKRELRFFQSMFLLSFFVCQFVANINSFGIIRHLMYAPIAIAFTVALIRLAMRFDRSARWAAMFIALLCGYLASILEMGLFSINLQFMSVLPITIISILVLHCLEINAGVVAAYNENIYLEECAKLRAVRLNALIETTKILAKEIRLPIEMTSNFMKNICSSGNGFDARVHTNEINQALESVNVVLERYLRGSKELNDSKADIVSIKGKCDAFAKRQGKKLHIVIIEDELVYAQMLEAFLAPIASSITLTKSTTGRFKKFPQADLFICDIDLGRSDSGLEVIEAIQTEAPAAVISIHSNRRPEELGSLPSAPFLAKPMTELGLVHLLQSVMKS